MSDSWTDIREAQVDSRTDSADRSADEGKETDMLEVGKRSDGGFRSVKVDGEEVGRISRYDDGSWVGFPNAGGRQFFGQVKMMGAAAMLAAHVAESLKPEEPLHALAVGTAGYYRCTCGREFVAVESFRTHIDGVDLAEHRDIAPDADTVDAAGLDSTLRDPGSPADGWTWAQVDAARAARVGPLSALRDLYDVVRELEGCGLLDVDEIGEGDEGLAERIRIAIHATEGQLVGPFGPQSVK